MKEKIETTNKDYAPATGVVHLSVETLLTKEVTRPKCFYHPYQTEILP